MLSVYGLKNFNLVKIKIYDYKYHGNVHYLKFTDKNGQAIILNKAVSKYKKKTVWHLLTFYKFEIAFYHNFSQGRIF